MNLKHASHYCSILAATVLVLLSAESAHSQVSITSRSSFINAFDFTDVGVDGESEETQNFGTFDQSVAFSDISASQTSNVAESIFDIQAFADGGTSATFFTEGQSLLFVEFEVTNSVNYELLGTLEHSGSTGSNTVVSLDGPDSNNRVEFITSSSGDQIAIDSSGILLPGTYNFNFESRSFGGTAGDPGPVLTSDVSLSFTTIPVPEPSSLMMAIGLLLVPGVRRTRS